MIIRAATTTDLPALCRLMQSVQDVHAEAHPEIFRATLDPEATARRFADIMANSNNLVIVADVAGEVVGYLYGQEIRPLESLTARVAHTGYIHDVSIAAQHRGNGLGKALVEEIVVILKQRGATRIGVDFWSFNDRARAFFASLGFVTQREFASRRLS